MFRFGTRTVALTLATGLAVAAACTRTEDPVEHYRSSASAGSASGGKGNGSAGKPSSSGNGGKPATNAGSSNAQGGEDAVPVDVGGAGGDGPVTPEPPVDFGCGDAPVSTEPFTKRALRSAAAECAQWHYCRFESGARALAESFEEYSAMPTEQTLSTARDAYSQAFSLASVIELMQFGPYPSRSEGADKDIYQGKGYREYVYSWPNSTRCRVEEQVVGRGYEKSMKTVLVSARGFFALDYLLYYDGSDTECAESSTAAQTWATLSEEELAAAKLDYTVALGNDILDQAQQLRADWAPEKGNFTPQLVDALGYGGDEQEAMKVMAWSLLYIERDVKDWKLGIPAGHTDDSPVSVAEAAYSGLKIGAIRQNLLGFRALYQGCGPDGEGLGFDDWLTEAGHPELAQQIIDAYVAAQAAADEAPELDAATPEQLEQLYQAIRVLTNLLKSDLFGAGSPIGLTLPPGLEGDTD